MFCYSMRLSFCPDQLEVNHRRKEAGGTGEMELSITVWAPQEGGDSRPIDRFAFEGLSCHTCVCLCVCVCVHTHVLYCIVFVSGGGGADTKTRPLKDKGGLKPNPASVNHVPQNTHTHTVTWREGGQNELRSEEGKKKLYTIIIIVYVT